MSGELQIFLIVCFAVNIIGSGVSIYYNLRKLRNE